MVEFALILPVLLLLMLGIIEFGYVLAAYTGLFNAAREGARYGVVEPMDLAGIDSKARSKIFLVNPNRAVINIAYDSGPGTAVFTDTDALEIGGSRVVISLTYDLPTITPVVQPLWRTFSIETRAARTIASLGEAASMLPTGPTGPASPPGEGDASIVISVAADRQTIHSGDTVTFTYTITNTSGELLTGVTIVDSLGNTIDVGDLAAGATWEVLVSEVVNMTTTNEVTVTGTHPESGTVSDSDSVTVTVILPALDLTVTVSPEEIYAGEAVTFTYIVQNTGDVELTDVIVEDSLSSTRGPVDLAIGQTVFWQVSYLVNETTTNDVTATGTDTLEGTVSDSESATVTVHEYVIPIIIDRPVVAGQTVVSGTGQVGRLVQIRDLNDPAFPNQSDWVEPDGTFTFEGLPALVAGHVIVVEGINGYEAEDAAVVQGDLADIFVDEPLCHDDTVITGSAQPGRTVDLSVTDTDYQYDDSTRVDASGTFTFTLPASQPLQDGQAVEVNGYAKTSGTVWVNGCTSDAYILLSPQCGSPGDVTFTVEGYQWATHCKHRTIKLYWGDEPDLLEEFTSCSSSFTRQYTKNDVTEGEYTVRAELWWKGQTLEWSDEAIFLSPCPAPNLVITDLGLATTGVISTYLPLDFSVTVANDGTRRVNSMFWVDLDDAEPVLEQAGIAWGAVSALGVGESTVITITVESGFATTGTHQVWGLADSWDDIFETDEDDNAFGPVAVEVTGVGTPPTPGLTGTATIEGETWVWLAGYPVPHARSKVWCVDADTGLEVTSTYSDDYAEYALNNLPADTYWVMAETWIDGDRYYGLVPSPITISDGETRVAIVIMYD